MGSEGQSLPLGPWNPGIASQLPRSLLALSTIFRPENVVTSVDQAHELSDFTGIAPHKLVAFRPDRLIVHELLIRVTADLSVPDGSKYADLGINFREITETILSSYIAPHMAGAHSPRQGASADYTWSLGKRGGKSGGPYPVKFPADEGVPASADARIPGTADPTGMSGRSPTDG